MKKIICFVILLFLMSTTAFAGSVPEDLMASDDALLFFAEVLEYHPNKENADIVVSPTYKIKGDDKVGTKQIYYAPMLVGNFKPKVGQTYLFAYYDEVNPTYIFEVTSYDVKEVKLKNVSGDMWERFEQYLNNGDFEKAEQKRLEKQNITQVDNVAQPQNAALPKENQAVNIYILVAAIVLIFMVGFVIGYTILKKNRKKNNK